MSDSGYQVRVLKQLLSLLAKEEGGKNKAGKESSESSSGAKELLSSLAGLAGKGKDELIQSICREIGQATAAVLKEPLAQLLKDRKLQLTIEFVPVTHDSKKSPKTNQTKKRGAERSRAPKAGANTRSR